MKRLYIKPTTRGIRVHAQQPLLSYSVTEMKSGGEPETVTSDEDW